MEQQLDATYLRPSFVSKAFGLSVAAIGLGTSILLAAYGISFFWRPMQVAIAPIDVRIANPELFVRQEKPFLMVPPETLHFNPQAPTNRPEQAWNSGPPRVVGDPVTPPQEVIQQEVIVFSSVKHSDGSIVTGWKYPNERTRSRAIAYLKYSSAYQQIEDDARVHQRGLWQGAFIAPWDWRATKTIRQSS